MKRSEDSEESQREPVILSVFTGSQVPMPYTYYLQALTCRPGHVCMHLLVVYLLYLRLQARIQFPRSSLVSTAPSIPQSGITYNFKF